MKIGKQTIYRWVYRLINSLPVRKAILFESAPDCTDNTKAVFDEMVRRGLNKRYDFVWMLHSDTAPDCTLPHVKFAPLDPKGIREKLQKLFLYARTVCMMSCNGFLLPKTPEQKAFFLCHGTPIKSHRGYYTVPNEIQYCLTASEGSADLIAYEADYPRAQMFGLGFPRNDVLTDAPIDIKTLLNTTCKKIIVWYPTFRQHKNGSKTAASNTLPIIHDGEQAKKLNKAAQDADVLIVLKPHYAQDLTYVKELGLSNIRFIDDSFFASNGISSYAFLAASDALITDYSSVYYDYTLVDKPIAVIWEDFDQYKESPGFAQDMEQCMAGAEKIYTVEDYHRFIHNVAAGQDLLQEARRKNRDWANCSTDGKNTQRVVDFIMEQVNL